MTTKTNSRGISLSASATANGWPAPATPTGPAFAGRGDFASRLGGRIRRMERRNRLMVKHAGYEG
jgi:hypothetical protein